MKTLVRKGEVGMCNYQQVTFMRIAFNGDSAFPDHR